VIDGLRASKQKLDEQFNAALEAAKNGRQIDEGFFTSLKAAFSTAGQLAASGANKVSDAAKKMAANVKAIYQDAKAKAELKELVKGLQEAVNQFDKLANNAPTIMKRDAEVSKEMALFRELFNKLIETLGARMTVTEGISVDDLEAIKQLLEQLKEKNQEE
jgi:soluble cytochrome b562